MVTKDRILSTGLLQHSRCIFFYIYISYSRRAYYRGRDCMKTYIFGAKRATYEVFALWKCRLGFNRTNIFKILCYVTAFRRRENV